MTPRASNCKSFEGEALRGLPFESVRGRRRWSPGSASDAVAATELTIDLNYRFKDDGRRPLSSRMAWTTTA